MSGHVTLALRVSVAVAALMVASGCSTSPQTLQAPAQVASGDPVLRVPERSDLSSPPPGPAPAPGTVRQDAGPFDDRFELSGLALQAGTVHGELTVTSDVSEIIVLEVHAAFYGVDGALLGTARQVTERGHGDTGPAVPNERVAVQITAPPSLRTRASAAVVWVPVLVNE